MRSFKDYITEGILYDDGSVYTGTTRFDPSRYDPHDQYMKHHGNENILTKIANTSKDLKEKVQAAKEIKMAQRKKEYWSRQPGFSMKTVLPRMAKLHADWEKSEKKGKK